MANDDYVAFLKRGVDAWNAWRDAESPHPSGPQRRNPRWGERRANLSGTNLSKAILVHSNLGEADLSGANLTAT